MSMTRACLPALKLPSKVRRACDSCIGIDNSSLRHVRSQFSRCCAPYSRRPSSQGPRTALSCSLCSRETSTRATFRPSRLPAIGFVRRLLHRTHSSLRRRPLRRPLRRSLRRPLRLLLRRRLRRPVRRPLRRPLCRAVATATMRLRLAFWRWRLAAAASACGDRPRRRTT
jgi:hypothetical protein